MGYSTAEKNAMLDARSASILYASLHSSDPGDTGANEISGGSPAYARKAITWNAASGGESTIANQPIFDVPACTVAYVGFWTAITGGTFRGSALLSPSPPEYTEQGTFKVTTGRRDLNTAGSSIPELSGDIVLAGIVIGASGYMVPQAAGSLSISPTTVSADGAMVPVGTLHANLPQIVFSATGTKVDSAIYVTGDLSMPQITSSGVGLLVPLATGDIAAPSPVAAATGVRVDAGTIAASVPSPAVSATGEQTSSGVNVSDNFNRANGGLGANWTTVTGELAPQIYNNKMVGASGGSSARWSADTFANDQWSMCRVIAVDPDNGYTGPMVRCSSSARTYYYAALDPTAYQETYIWKVVNGVPTAIAYMASSPGLGYYRLEAEGTTIRLKFHATDPAQVATILSATDSAIASGSAGVKVDANTEVDDWSGGDL